MLLRHKNSFNDTQNMEKTKTFVKIKYIEKQLECTVIYALVTHHYIAHYKLEDKNVFSEVKVLRIHSTKIHYIAKSTCLSGSATPHPTFPLCVAFLEGTSAFETRYVKRSSGCSWANLKFTLSLEDSAEMGLSISWPT